MEVRTRGIANLVLLMITTLSIQYPATAQGQIYGRSQYPKILSATEDSSGNFLLLNLQSKNSLAAPSIQYLPGIDGKTMMVADFYGLQWNQGSRVIRPANDAIESVRIGQFQDSPPVFRISICTSRPAVLKQIEFNAEPNSLFIKFPAKQTDFAQSAQQLQTSAPSLNKRSSASNWRKSKAISSSADQTAGSVGILPYSNPETNKQLGNRSSQEESTSEAKASENTVGAKGEYQSILTSKKAVHKKAKETDANQMPFSRGGLFMTLEKNDEVTGQTKPLLTEAALPMAPPRQIQKNEIVVESKNKESIPMPPKKVASNILLPLAAPDFHKQSEKLDKSSAAKPTAKIASRDETEHDENADSHINIPTKTPAKESSSLAGKLKRLFQKPEQVVLNKSDEEPKLAPDRKGGDVKQAFNTKDSSNNQLFDKRNQPDKVVEHDETADKEQVVAEASPNPEIELSGKTDSFKVKLKFDSKIKYRSFTLDDPPRFVVDLENTQTHCEPLTEPEKNPWLKSLRFGTPVDNLSRVVLDLAQNNLQVKEELDQQAQILTLSIGPAALEANAQRSPLRAARGTEVVLDAGHGGSDPGAQRGDIQEKEITLAITQKLKRYLEERGVRVVMTRTDDTFVSLEDRVKITNANQPDAFVSIHINALETNSDIKGIETYYHNDHSRALAGKVHEKLVEKLVVPDRSVRKARFYVVNHTDRPAILAEVGFISNKDEREKLISSDYQAKVAESLGQGVILFLTNASDLATTTVSNAEPEASASRLSGGSKVKSKLAQDRQSAVKQNLSEPEKTGKITASSVIRHPQ